MSGVGPERQKKKSQRQGTPREKVAGEDREVVKKKRKPGQHPSSGRPVKRPAKAQADGGKRPASGNVRKKQSNSKDQAPIREYAREVSKSQRPKTKKSVAAMQGKTKPKKKTSKLLSLIWDITFYGFLIVLVLGVVMFNFNDNPKKAFLGYRFMTVLTDSMAPGKEEKNYDNGFRSGALVFVMKTNPKTLKKGDIITFNPVKGNNDAYLTHRIIKVHKELKGTEGLFFTTKGDANTGADIPIEASQVVGKIAFSIPNVGNIVKFFKENIVVVAIFAASIFAFFIVLKYYLGMEENAPPAQRKKRAIKQ